LAFEGKLSSANVFSAKGTSKNLGTDGLNVHLQVERFVARVEKKDEEPSLKVTNTGTAGLQFNNDKVHFLAELKVPIQSEGKLGATGSLHAKPVDNVDVGVKADWEAGGAPKFEGKLIGGNDNLEGAVSFAFPSKVWGLNFWHSPCTHFQWAATVALPPSDAKKDPEPVINVTGNYKFDDATTLKARVTTIVDRSASKDNAFRTALSLQQKVNASTTVTVGADVNLNNALNIGSGKKGSNVGAASSAGFQIAFK